MQIAATIMRHSGRTAIGAIVLVAVGGLGIYWFGPQYIFIDRRVDEALPTAGAEVGQAPAAELSAQRAAPGGEGEALSGSPATLAEGGFRSLEHASSGTALLVELPDGRRYLRLQDLETSNGPDLRVVLTDQPLSDDWRVWDDGELLDLGGLKGNLGSSNYVIGPKVDLAAFRTAVIWCRRFSVGFAVALLEPAA